MASFLFWVVAIILVGSALMVVGARKIVHSALALVVVFAMAAGIYLLLNAEFIAIVQILIYAGAVTILILFALMLTRIDNRDQLTNPNSKTWWGALIVSALVCMGVILASTFTHSTVLAGTAAAGSGYGSSAVCALPPNNVAYIGTLLYSPVVIAMCCPLKLRLSCYWWLLWARSL